MEASFMDLRKKSGEILHALDRNEPVVISYRGRPRAIIQPINQGGAKIRAEEHAAFGLWADRDDTKDVMGYVRNLRRGRTHDR